MYRQLLEDTTAKKFGFKWHLLNGLVGCLPGVTVLGLAAASRELQKRDLEDLKKKQKEKAKGEGNAGSKDEGDSRKDNAAVVNRDSLEAPTKTNTSEIEDLKQSVQQLQHQVNELSQRSNISQPPPSTATTTTTPGVDTPQNEGPALRQLSRIQKWFLGSFRAGDPNGVMPLPDVPGPAQTRGLHSSGAMQPAKQSAPREGDVEGR
eukprot:GFYU01024243.1.p1 GENE.GFYU01024243.1~~GFYU01024243.1.p1  ORF type:complete len:206 (-),score=31.12 GFYU01024243.1:181-798(-)